MTFTAFLAKLIGDGKLTVTPSGKTVVFQDPFQLSRDLGETEEARAVIASCATLREMLLNREQTVWAGNLLMAEYLPDVMTAVAKRRLFNVTSIGEHTIVTASVSEYASLKKVDQTGVEILSVEDLILG